MLLPREMSNDYPQLFNPNFRCIPFRVIGFTRLHQISTQVPAHDEELGFPYTREGRHYL
jgi:hypothetical protein